VGKEVVHDGIDPEELRRLAGSDPLPHAFALYDLDHFPERARWISLQRDGQLHSYLLIWYGEPSAPYVQWVGTGAPDLLVPYLPKGPFVALVPVEVAPLVERARKATGSYPVEVLRRPRTAGAVPGGRERTDAGAVFRRLAPTDVPLLERFADLHDGERYLRALARVDLTRERVHGAISPDRPARLLSCARTVLELPGLWFIGGVYTDPSHRRRGLARSVVGQLVEVAREQGADSALQVRADNEAALRVYTHLGFRREYTRVWIDAGGGPPP
jgi:ribosomal protein S18 acetylase RimI-like enzyme